MFFFFFKLFNVERYKNVCVRRGQGINCVSQFSPFIKWFPGVEFGLSGLATRLLPLVLLTEARNQTQSTQSDT